MDNNSHKVSLNKLSIKLTQGTIIKVKTYTKFVEIKTDTCCNLKKEIYECWLP